MTAARRAALIETVAITAATALLSAIMIFVVPEFIKIFADFEVEMPVMTLVLISISSWTLRLWFLAPLIPIGICLLLNLLRASGVSGESWAQSVRVLFIVAMACAIDFIVIVLSMPLVSVVEELSAR